MRVHFISLEGLSTPMILHCLYSLMMEFLGRSAEEGRDYGLEKLTHLLEDGPLCDLTWKNNVVEQSLLRTGKTQFLIWLCNLLSCVILAKYLTSLSYNCAFCEVEIYGRI